MCHVLCCTRRCRPDCTAGVLAPDDLSAACKDSVDPDPACYEENLFKRRYLRALVSTALRYLTGRLVAGTCAALVSTEQSARDDLRARPGRPALLLPRVPHRAHAAASAARVHRAGREHEGAAGVRRLGQARTAARTGPRCDPPPCSDWPHSADALRHHVAHARALVPRDGRAGARRRSLPEAAASCGTAAVHRSVGRSVGQAELLGDGSIHGRDGRVDRAEPQVSQWQRSSRSSTRAPP